MGKIQIDEAEHTRLVEAAGAKDELATELETVRAQLTEATKPTDDGKGKGPRTLPQQLAERLDAQQEEMNVLKAREGARDVIGEELSEAWLATTTIARLNTELMSNLPLTEAGELDKAALRDRCVEARDRAELEAAETLDAAGFGRPTGLGASTPPIGGDTTKYAEQITEALGDAFGLTEAESKTAVKGR